MTSLRTEKPQSGARAAGFTLVELLVAFSLLGLIATVSLGALQFGTRVWERVAANGETSQRLQLSQNLLRRQLGRAVARAGSQASTRAKLFQGGPDSIAFVAPLPRRGAAGGLYDQRLILSGNRLLLTWQERDRVAQPDGVTERKTDPSVRGEAVILSGITNLEIAYLDRQDPGQRPAWVSRWTKPGLPRLVRLRVSFDEPGGNAWPELLVRLHLAKSKRSGARAPANAEG